MKHPIIKLAGIVLFGLLIRWSLFTVDRAEYAYVTRFGRHVATYDGENDNEAGLHWKWPWPIETVQRLDHRLQFFDLPGAELLTHDPKGKTIDKTLTIDAYVCWRIADSGGVDRFIRTIGTPERGRSILGQRISSALGAVVGQMELDELISTEPGKVDWNREKLRNRLLNGAGDLEQGPVAENSLRERTQQAYGIEIVDIRLRRFNHPPGVREAIYERIRSERNKKVADYQSSGAKQAKDIKSASDRKVAELLADARADEQRLKGEADAEADRIRNEAHSKDARFYAFLKKLEEYQRILGDNKSVLLLSANREIFDLLLKPPRPENGQTTPKPAANGTGKSTEIGKRGGS